MPAKDGTGPLGKGMMTGGGFGYCRQQENYNLENSSSPRYFNGMRCGSMRGRGLRNRIFSAPSMSEEKSLLENRLAFLQSQAGLVRQKLETLQNKENEL